MPTRKAEGFSPDRLLTGKAADMMKANPVSIREDATVQELVAVLTERSISGVPVINDAGRPVGVVTQADVLIHDREKGEYTTPAADTRDWIAVETRPQKAGTGRVVLEDPTQVREIMTPIVFSVALKTPARKVVEDLLGMKVHRLFVVDEGGALVGVISPLDVLRFIA